MNASEFREAQVVIGESHDELAAALGQTPHVVRAWGDGRVAIPRAYARQLAWMKAAAERRAALQTSGLPECEWLHGTEGAFDGDDTKAILKHAALVEKHVDTCPVCLARTRFVDERFGPMPDMPQTGFMRIIGWGARLPAWSRPAAFGAAALGAVVTLRVAFSLPTLVSRPRQLGVGLLAIVAAASAGAIGGFAYSLVRPVFRPLGRIGEYLTGIACVFAYMGALVIVAPLAFGERLITDTPSAVIFGVVTVFFGLILGHSLFRE